MSADQHDATTPIQIPQNDTATGLPEGVTTGVGDGRALVELIAKIADDRRARDIVILKVGDAVGYADWFVLCTGGTDRQTKAIHDSIVKEVKDELRAVPKRVEGLPEATWVLVDYLDVVVHIFTPESREFYRLDRLYGDVERREYESTPD